MKNFKVRNPMYFIGLFIMTIGIVLSVKSNLGVPPSQFDSLYHDVCGGN